MSYKIKFKQIAKTLTFNENLTLKEICNAPYSQNGGGLALVGFLDEAAKWDLLLSVTEDTLELTGGYFGVSREINVVNTIVSGLNIGEFLLEDGEIVFIPNLKHTNTTSLGSSKELRIKHNHDHFFTFMVSWEGGQSVLEPVMAVDATCARRTISNHLEGEALA